MYTAENLELPDYIGFGTDSPRRDATSAGLGSSALRRRSRGGGRRRVREHRRWTPPSWWRSTTSRFRAVVDMEEALAPGAAAAVRGGRSNVMTGNGIAGQRRPARRRRSRGPRPFREPAGGGRADGGIRHRGRAGRRRPEYRPHRPPRLPDAAHHPGADRDSLRDASPSGCG